MHYFFILKTGILNLHGCKHGTYVKWYIKEKQKIMLFMENKDNTIDNMIKNYDINIQEKLTEYYKKLKELYMTY